jgi:hypothetical protein
MRTEGITTVRALLGGYRKWMDETNRKVTTGEKP